MLTNKEVLGTWVGIVGGFLFLKSASDNRIIVKNRYTNEIPEEDLPDPLSAATLALILGVFTSVWFIFLTMERLREIELINEEGEDNIDLWPNIAIVLGVIVGLVGVALRLEAALKRESEKIVPRVFIV